MNVVGVDLSTRAIDLVKLAEDSNRAEWVRCELPDTPTVQSDRPGQDAWERALAIRDALPESFATYDGLEGWWSDVYLVAIEYPVMDQKRRLRLIQGAILASLPPKLRQPHCCWEVHPSTWKAALGLKGKPTQEDVTRIELATLTPDPDRTHHFSFASLLKTIPEPEGQNARDAYCLALFARDSNAAAVSVALQQATAKSGTADSPPKRPSNRSTKPNPREEQDALRAPGEGAATRMTAT